MISTQMLKGTLEGCVLAVIGQKETYGYEISEQLGKYGFGKVAGGDHLSAFAETGKERVHKGCFPGF